MSGTIRVGTASWTDPGFIAHWYPPGLPAPERLPYYAERFNLVELNSSFYAVPDRKLVQRWCDITPAGFVFDVKLHRLLSRHSTALKMLPPELRTLAKVEGGKVQLTPRLERALAERFLLEAKPFIAAGKLGSFLLQLTPAFSPRLNRLDELDGIFEVLHGHAIAVELRNRNWVDDEHREDTLAFFAKRGLTFVGVDAPEGEHFMTMPGTDSITNPKLAYVRLHGRNLKGYVTGRTVAERFDYLYSDEELAEVAARAKKLARQAADTHIIYNNNCDDYALRNAATFQRMLAQEQSSDAARSDRTQTGNRAPRPGRTLEFDFGEPKNGRRA